MSAFAPASATMDPTPQPPALVALSASSSRPIVLAIRAMAVRGVILGSCHIGAAARSTKHVAHHLRVAPCLAQAGRRLAVAAEMTATFAGAPGKCQEIGVHEHPSVGPLSTQLGGSSPSEIAQNHPLIRASGCSLRPGRGPPGVCINPCIYLWPANLACCGLCPI